VAAYRINPQGVRSDRLPVRVTVVEDSTLGGSEETPSGVAPSPAIPSHEAMEAIAGTVGQTGAVSKYETVIVLTPSQIDEAAGMTIAYTPPGR
jgi:hypothetical protein